LEYYLRRFKAARIVVLRKSNKGDYGLFKVWRFIALFNTIDKLIETAIAKRLYDAAETYILFSNFQIGARLGRFTEIIFEFLTEQVYIVWKVKKVVIFLFLDLSSVFDRVFFTRIYQVLRTRRISEWLA